MKKTELLARLAQLKAEGEQKAGDELETMPLRILELLVDYMNDSDIAAAVNEINF